MIDFEKLGAFYLGRRVDDASGARTGEPVLYDARDLTTHAVIIGMTGSGKTGLGIGILEEAALDHVPVIAIDPKGDLGNLLLTFPALAADDFRPWVSERQATERGLDTGAFAKEQAAMWQKGLAEWGQDGARIGRLRAGTDIALYTPGSNAGLPVSILQSFGAPPRPLVDRLLDAGAHHGAGALARPRAMPASGGHLIDLGGFGCGHACLLMTRKLRSTHHGGEELHHSDGTTSLECDTHRKGRAIDTCVTSQSAARARSI